MPQNLPVVVILTVKNNEKLIQNTSEKIIKVLKNLINSSTISDFSYLLLVDCNSKDSSWYEAGKIVAKNPRLCRAIKLENDTKLSQIIKNSSDFKNIVINFNNFQNIEHYILNSEKSIIIDKFHRLKDIFKSSKFSIIDELP